MLTNKETDEKILAKANEIAKLVSEHYKVPLPDIKIGHGIRAWCYYRKLNCLITIPRGIWVGIENATIHELAHVVSWHLLGNKLHDESFQRTLSGIAALVLGDSTKYRWDLEYDHIAKAAGATINVNSRRREALIQRFVQRGMARDKAEQLVDGQI